MSTRLLWPLVLLFVVLFAAVKAQQPVHSGEELFIDRFGCWNCHGKTGGGGGAGPSLSKSQLPLRTFVKSVRLPRDTMPRFSPALASDVDLAVVYHWLDGREAVATPPLISLGLKATSTATGDGQAPADTELELIATTTGTAATSGKSPASLRYRVTLANATSPVANRTIHYRLASSLEWSTFTTDERGEAVLNPDHKFAQAHQEAVDANRPGTQLKMRLERGRYALVIEALEDAPSVDPTVVGLATAVVNVP